MFLDLLYFFTLVSGPRRSLSLELSDTTVSEPEIQENSGSVLKDLMHVCRNRECAAGVPRLIVRELHLGH